MAGELAMEDTKKNCRDLDEPEGDSPIGRPKSFLWVGCRWWGTWSYRGARFLS